MPGHAPCAHAVNCGGCSYQDLTYAEELSQKEALIRETFAPYAEAFEGVTPAPSPDGYRNKMEFAFGDEGRDGGLALGVRKRRSFYEVVTPRGCRIIPEDFKSIALAALDYFNESGETFYHRKRHTGALRHLVIRRGEFTGELLINLVTASGLTAPPAPLAERVCALPLRGEAVGFLHTVNDGVADVVKNENVTVLRGRDFYYEKLCGLTFKVTAFSFFQTNSAGAETLYNTVKEYAKEADTLYDLYCGAGTIAQILAGGAKSVTGVELSADAARAADENARLNGVTNCRFIAGDVLDVMDGLASGGARPDVVVVDPPRDGLHPKIPPKIINARPGKIVYVSCKPSSLARDLTAFTDGGYRVERLKCVDMFPRTPHVETVALLVRQG